MSPSKKTEIKRFMRAVERPDAELVLLLQDVEDPVNVGSAFRIADACRVKELILTGITARPPHKLITKVGRGKDRRVPWRYFEDVEAVLTELHAKGYFIAAIEITPTSVPYFQASYARQTCLVVGHEDHGVTRKALSHTDAAVFVPMYGKGASLNVHVALAVVTFDFLHRSLQRPSSPG